MDVTRFKGHYILHDRDSTGAPRLVEIMANKVGVESEFFKQPHPPYEFKEDASALESYLWLRSCFLSGVMSNSVLFGFGIGGLLAAKLQEDFPVKGLSVVAINAPTFEGSISLETHVPNRVALYSSAYMPIAGRCNWSLYAGQAYDMSWLLHGIKNAKYGLAYLLTTYMQIENLTMEVKSFMDFAPEVPKAASASFSQ